MAARILYACGLIALLFIPAISYAERPTCNISLVPMLIASNQFATLNWATQNADWVTISSVGQVQPKGSTMVQAKFDRYFSLHAQGKDGYCDATATLTVHDPYSNYGYFTPTVQSVVYPLIGYTQPSARTVAYSQPTYTTYYYDYDDYYDWDDYYYFDKMDAYYDRLDAGYYDDLHYGEDGYGTYIGGGGTYYDNCDYWGCWE